MKIHIKISLFLVSHIKKIFRPHFMGYYTDLNVVLMSYHISLTGKQF